jgi:polar amino acid transport system substrate-binding protein
MPRLPLARALPCNRLARRLLPAALALTSCLGPMAGARAEGVVQHVVRTGQVVMAGQTDSPPLVTLTPDGKAQGYAVEIARLVQAELQKVIGKPVRLRLQGVLTTADQVSLVGSGKADFSCGVPFSWERDAGSKVDFTLPIGLSGLRLLAPAGRFDGSPAALAGRRIGVVAGSLAQNQLQGMQPKAVAVSFPNSPAAVSALVAGTVDGVIGDSLLLRLLAKQQNATNLVLTPDESYQHYAISCVVPENDSAFRDVVNLAIARLLQGYLDGVAETVALVHRWVGPGSSVDASPETIRIYFENVMNTVEPIRTPAAPQAPSKGN